MLSDPHRMIDGLDEDQAIARLAGVSVHPDDADDLIGIRFPVGLDYNFDGAPLDIFVQIVPILELAPKTDFELEGAIGARFFF